MPLDVRHDDPRQRRYWFRLAGHTQVGANEVNMEQRPGRGTDICSDRKSNSRLTFAHCSRGTDLEPEPVSNVSACRSSQVGLGHLRRLRPVHVDIDGRPHAQITRQQGRRKQLSGQGLDAGPQTIAWHLRHHHQLSVSPATISRYLTRNGLVTPEPKKRPRSSYIRFAAELPN